MVRFPRIVLHSAACGVVRHTLFLSFFSFRRTKRPPPTRFVYAWIRVVYRPRPVSISGTSIICCEVPDKRLLWLPLWGHAAFMRIPAPVIIKPYAWQWACCRHSTGPFIRVCFSRKTLMDSLKYFILKYNNNSNNVNRFLMKAKVFWRWYKPVETRHVGYYLLIGIVGLKS